jgi:tRNA A-37 threonylcarbamoyl transferase component Bud32/Tol biopolymer transport system component
MSLQPGTTLGSYQIVSLLGAGGMGEVYRAIDTVLKRQIALKVLPPEVANDPERVARFQREAEVLASLNHPNIAHLYGIEKSNGTLALVMELVEGPTLADRIAKGPLPLDEAIPIAKQVAEALECAHEQGIIHRDLKPANIKVRDDGAVKVLDFGLAKAMEPSASGVVSASLTNSPTITSPALMTGVGMLVGTAAYMSPEQARGRSVDKRADIWAFGCVLLEMLTGTATFAGETLTDTIAAVMKSEPAWSKLPAGTPPAIRSMLRRCLQKDPAQRLQHIGDARIEIHDAITGLRDGIEAPAARTPTAHQTSALRWIVIGATVLIVATGGWVVSRAREHANDDRVLRLEIDPPAGGRFVFGTNVGGIALSPDGRTAAYIATVGGETALWIRSLDNAGPTLVPGTTGAAYPFWSPDSKSVAFSAGGKLQRFDLASSTPQIVADVAAFRGGAWTSDGRIILGAVAGGLLQIPSGGGQPSPLTPLVPADGDIRHSWPQVLPQGQLLYLDETSKGDSRGVYATSLARPNQRVKLIATDVNALYAPSPDGRGHLLSLRNGTLVAQEFDSASLQLSGESHRIASPVANTGIVGQVHASASMDGKVLYSASTTLAQFAWFDRRGTSLGVVSEPGEYSGPFRLSPDGHRAVTVFDGPGGTDLGLLELERGIASRFASAGPRHTFPLWSPDGRTVVGSKLTELFRKSFRDGGDEERLVETPIPLYPTDWSMDGRLMVAYSVAPGTQRDLWVVPVTPEGKIAGSATPHRSTPGNESWGRFYPEPNPRWLAYQSDETGRYEVYIDTFPVSHNPIRVSIGGGQYPQWGAQTSHDTRELFYVAPGFKLMVASLKIGSDAVEPSPPRELFALPAVDIGFSPYETAPDGQRFLVRANPERESARPLTVIVNWPALLHQ